MNFHTYTNDTSASNPWFISWRIRVLMTYRRVRQACQQSFHGPTKIFELFSDIFSLSVFFFSYVHNRPNAMKFFYVVKLQRFAFQTKHNHLLCMLSWSMGRCTLESIKKAAVAINHLFTLIYKNTVRLLASKITKMEIIST